MVSLDRNSLFARYGIDHADVMVLFGGSILAGGDALAEAIKDRIASTYIIVGGAGHTTETLRQTVQSEYPSVRTANLTEAEIFQKYLQEIHGMWESDRYINLLMGEIPRLRDDENGYGPAGKGFIAHVDIPENVKKAFSELKYICGDKIREANPLYVQWSVIGESLGNAAEIMLMT